MTLVPIAHLAGVPVEEALASFGPAVLLTAAAASATVRRRLASRRPWRAPSQPRH